ncbi:MAG: hypothetical protein Q7J29_10555 [Stagnimonas sp.]|nr:hypothetical protein [Stagnimonas sp.]
MKPLLRKSLLGATALALLAGAAQAALSTLPAPAEKLIARAEAFRADLDLTPAQAALWTQAMAQTKAAFAAGRSRHEQSKADLAARLASADAQPRAFLVQIDAERQAIEPQRRAATAGWLSFYEALDATQKAAVNAELASKLQRFERLRARLGDRLSGDLLG